MQDYAKQAAAAKILSREAPTLEGILQHLSHFMPQTLIGGVYRERLMQCARRIPSDAAALPFGFEVPLHCREAQADLGVHLAAGTQTAAYFERQSRLPKAMSAQTGLAGLIQDVAAENSVLEPLIGRNFMLEFDIDPRQSFAANHFSQSPGVFVKPADHLFGGLKSLDAVELVTDAIVAAAGWKPEPMEKQHVMAISQALETHQRIASFGVFPARERGIRLALKGFSGRSEVHDFLRRNAGKGDNFATIEASIAAILERFENVDYWINIDVFKTGMGPRLGLSFAIRHSSFDAAGSANDAPQLWTDLSDCLNGSGFAISEKLSALAKWCVKPQVLLGASGSLLLIRRINHFKIVTLNNRINETKAYIYFYLVPLAG